MNINELPIGKQIRIKRIIDDLSQKDLALMLNINSSNLARWESGEREIPKNKKELIMAYLRG